MYLSNVMGAVEGCVPGLGDDKQAGFQINADDIGNAAAAQVATGDKPGHGWVVA